MTAYRSISIVCSLLALLSFIPLSAQTPVKTEYTDFENDTLMLNQVEVKASRGRIKNELTPLNTETLGRQEMFRAACCNLGEAFVTNPSVDVSYSDAATGARQIKLLGLSGTYVQMLQENIPAFRGIALPFGLGYVPGPWMQSIQVSKGAASVKNGYEGITGQINIEYVKPQGVEAFRVNAYYDSNLKAEVNLDAEKHLGEHLSTGILAHYEKSTRDHDMNKDGFIDMPKVEQINLMDRWAWVSDKWISQLSVRGLKESRWSGVSHHNRSGVAIDPFCIDIDTKRIEGQWKNALIMNRDRNESLALMLKGSYQDMEDVIGQGGYRANQKNGYAQLLYEADVAPGHNLSVGLTLNHDYLNEHLIRVYNVWRDNGATIKETTYGGYAQYTYTLDEKLTAMAGIRYDHSSIHGSFVTPRLHLKYSPAEWFTARLAAGKGYRTPHPVAENIALLSSSRTVVYNEGGPCGQQLKQEEAWNTGLTLGFKIPVADETLELNADYYYTKFLQQVIIDRDQAHAITIYNLPKDGKSYSHVMQVDATYPFPWGFSLTAAYRWQDVRQTEMNGLRRVPLTSRYKALATLSYKTPLEFWQIDVTYQHNGDGRMPDCHNGMWKESYDAFGQLSAQVTREFRYFSLYIGGENLIGFRQKNPIIDSFNPYGANFDASMIWGPTEGAMIYAGFRVNIEQ